MRLFVDQGIVANFGFNFNIYDKDMVYDKKKADLIRISQFLAMTNQ